MRIFIYTKNRKDFKKDIPFLQENLYARVDFFEDIEEAEYCIDIRHYDIVYIEYQKEYHKKYFNILKSINNMSIKPIVYFLNAEKINDFNLYPFINKDELTIDFKKHIIKILPNNESKIIKKGDLTINIKNKNIFYEKDGELKEIVFEKSFDFLVFLYFVRNYGDVININNLLDATCEEPEHAKNSLIESSISSIRKSFQEILKLNPIKAFKKVGYQFSLGD